ncbi:MAG: PAS domain S-box protein [Nitriliruptoraceae bacterium]|nr:PAS domain S-box protein [Nitriliruptoraceae bacterium]
MVPGTGSNEQARLILETANDAFISVDTDGTIVDWNPAATRIFGWERDEALGRRLVSTVVPPELREAHLKGFDLHLATGESRLLFRPVELPAVHRDGRELRIQLTIWPSETPHGPRFNAFLRDVTDTVRLHAYLEVLRRIATTVNATDEPEVATRAALDEVARFTGWPVGHAYLRGWDEEVLRPTGWWSAGTEQLPGIDPFLDVTAAMTFLHDGLPGRVAANERPAWIPDMSLDASCPRQGAASSAGLHSAFAFPVVSGDRVLGVLEFFSTAVQDVDEDLQELMLQVGMELGRVFDRARWGQEARRADEQERVAERLRELEGMKNTFLRAISHELRTPLTVIRGVSELLHTRDEDLDAAQRRTMTERLLDHAKQLEALLLDLLDLDRLTRGTLTVHRRSVDPVAIAQQVIDRVVASGAGDERLTVLDVATDGMTATIDPVMFERIVENLLLNARRHTPGGTEVRLRLARLDGAGHGDGDGITVIVEDDGPGIPEDQRSRVLEAFARLPGSDDTAGTGIGLSLVERFAALHDGEVVIGASASGGARFEVRLPAGPSATER